MADLYSLDNVKNSEIEYRWTKLCIEAEDDTVLDHVTSFLKSQGRMKFVRPLFRSLGASKMGKDSALRLFQEVADTYHPIARKVVSADLGLSQLWRVCDLSHVVILAAFPVVWCRMQTKLDDRSEGGPVCSAELIND